MICKECGEMMELRFNVEHIYDFIIYICSKCGHTKKFTQEEVLIFTFEALKKEC